MCNMYRFPQLRVGQVGGSNVTESLHRKNKLLVRMILQSLHQEHHLLFESFANGIKDFLARVYQEDGAIDIDISPPFDEFMDELSMDDVGHLCEWLIEKIDCLASTKWKPSQQELEEEDDEDEEHILGDVDLFGVSEDGCFLQPNKMWLEHLMSREIDQEGQPRKIQGDNRGGENMSLKDGLVLDWLYGSIVSTAEKARDAAQKPLGMDRPSLETELNMLRKALEEMTSLQSYKEELIELQGKLDTMDNHFASLNKVCPNLPKNKSQLLLLLKREQEICNIYTSFMVLLKKAKDVMDGRELEEFSQHLNDIVSEGWSMRKWLTTIQICKENVKTGKKDQQDIVPQLVACNDNEYQCHDVWVMASKFKQKVRKESATFLKLMDAELFKKEAVISFFEFNLVNVGCDDLGAVIGVEILLPMFQEKIEQQAENYFNQQAEQLQQQILDMEAKEKAEAARKKERKKAKKKAKKVAPQREEVEEVTETHKTNSKQNLQEEIGDKEEVGDKNDTSEEISSNLEEQGAKTKEHKSKYPTSASIEQLVIDYLSTHKELIQSNGNISVPDKNDPSIHVEKIKEADKVEEHKKAQIMNKEACQQPLQCLLDIKDNAHKSNQASSPSTNTSTSFEEEIPDICPRRQTTSVVVKKALRPPQAVKTQSSNPHPYKQEGSQKRLEQQPNPISIERKSKGVKEGLKEQPRGDSLQRQAKTEVGPEERAEEDFGNREAPLIVGSSIDGHSIDDFGYQCPDDVNCSLVDWWTDTVTNYDGSSEVGCSSNVLPPSTLTPTRGYTSLDCSSTCDMGNAQDRTISTMDDTQFKQEHDGEMTSFQGGFVGFQPPIWQNVSNVTNCVSQNVQDVQNVQDGVFPQQNIVDMTFQLFADQSSAVFSQQQKGTQLQAQDQVCVPKVQSCQSLQDMVSLQQHQCSSQSRQSLESLTSFPNTPYDQRLQKTETELQDACKQLTFAVIGLEQIKESVICPLSRCLMDDPVVAADGYTYNRDSIENWMLSSSTSPTTSLPLSSSILIPNQAVRGIIEQLQKLGCLGLVGLL
eukprot:TRINITY_DN3635_c0_g2_i2.p1 TRINITY_DN3635_c0_g2~~TRINITY_DN3635_c0_g2_i2.p1  ORF type:complete len:1081 (+),score=203.19 TRINITY_DN3635_c0_g2_i2:118-3243(+)